MVIDVVAISNEEKKAIAEVKKIAKRVKDFLGIYINMVLWFYDRAVIEIILRRWQKSWCERDMLKIECLRAKRD